MYVKFLPPIVFYSFVGIIQLFTSIGVLCNFNTSKQSAQFRVLTFFILLNFGLNFAIAV